MKFLLTCLMTAPVVVGLTPMTAGAAEGIQIFSHGKGFSSIQEYKSYEKKQETFRLQRSDAPADLEAARSAFEDLSKKQNIPKDIQFDPAKVKTIVVSRGDQPNPSQDALKKVSVDGSVNRVISDVKDGKDLHPKGQIDEYELEDVLRNELSHQRRPAMVVKEQDKLRITVHNVQVEGDSAAGTYPADVSGSSVEDAEAAGGDRQDSPVINGTNNASPVEETHSAN